MFQIWFDVNMKTSVLCVMANTHHQIVEGESGTMSDRPIVVTPEMLEDILGVSGGWAGVVAFSQAREADTCLHSDVTTDA